MSDRIEIRVQLEKLMGKKLQYVTKWNNCDFFQLGFGDVLPENEKECKRLKLNQYAIHFTSGILFYWNDNSIKGFYEDAIQAQLDQVAVCLLGKSVLRVALSEKNDFWIDFGVCRAVIPTEEDGEESWRFIEVGTNLPHVVATNIDICMNNEENE